MADGHHQDKMMARLGLLSLHAMLVPYNLPPAQLTMQMCQKENKPYDGEGKTTQNVQAAPKNQ
jgi:hypothetical protein